MCIVGASALGFRRLINVESGLSDGLALPIVSLPAQGFVEVELADGSSAALGVYGARVLWDGQQRPIPVYETEGAPLVGMSLLRGSRLTVDVVPGGEVAIEDLG